MRKFILAATLCAAAFFGSVDKASAHGWWGPRFVYIYRPWYSITYPWSGYIPGFDPFWTPSLYVQPGYYLYPGYFYVPYGTIYAPFYGDASEAPQTPAQQDATYVRRGPRVPVTEGSRGPQVAGRKAPADSYRWTKYEE